jgi:hypothetical protein
LQKTKTKIPHKISKMDSFSSASTFRKCNLTSKEGLRSSLLCSHWPARTSHKEG